MRLQTFQRKTSKATTTWKTLDQLFSIQISCKTFSHTRCPVHAHAIATICYCFRLVSASRRRKHTNEEFSLHALKTRLMCEVCQPNIFHFLPRVLRLKFFFLLREIQVTSHVWLRNEKQKAKRMRKTFQGENNSITQ